MLHEKNPLITGTLLLTVAGFITRIMGFFYRIFLSQTIGEEGMGIYQLIAPIMALSFSLTAAGIQTGISKYVASCQGEYAGQKKLHVLQIGMLCSLALSVLVGFFLFDQSEALSKYFLLETRCAPLIRIYALSVPLSAVHSCTCGYYYGMKKTVTPAITQLFEQLIRVSCVFLLCQYLFLKGQIPTVSIAAVGLVARELASMMFCLFSIQIHSARQKTILFHFTYPTALKNSTIFRTLFKMAVPLSFSRIILNLMQSIEAVYIPNRLQLYGLSTKEALSLYGVLTGMAFPLIFFPSTLTNSLSVLLLPYISEADSLGQRKKIVSAFRKCFLCCLFLGILCGLFFFFTGSFLGSFLFHSKKAGIFIVSLSYICPFLYLGGVLTSILHGLGKMITSFWLNLAALSIRLCFVFLAIPKFGIQGYLVGILVSQLVFCLLILVALKDYIYYNKTVF